MKYFATLFLTIFTFAFMQGQTVVDVNADYFWLDVWKNINLVKKNHNSIIVIEIDYDNYDRTIQLDTTIYEDTSISEFKVDYVRENETFLPISKLYKNKKDKFISQLLEYQFNNVYEDGFVRHKINITKNNNLLVRDYSYSSDVSLNEYDTIPFIILRINRKHHIIAFDNDDSDEHFIMQTSKNNFVRIETDQYKLQIIKKEPNDSIIKELINFNNRKHWDTKITVQQIIKEKGKYGMKNLLGEQILPCTYDTIIIPNKNELFLALKNGKGMLYNRYFRQIANNIRCVLPVRNLFSPYIVLQNNKIRYITDDFEICDTLKNCIYIVCGTVTSYNFKTEKTENGFKIHKEIGGMTQIIPQVFPFFLNERYDNLLFLNGQNQFYYDENSDVEFRNPNFLVFEKNKKFGIVEIEMPLLDCRQDSLQKYSWDNYSYFEDKKIVFEHQNITPTIIVSDLDSVIFSSKYNYPAKIYKNGLCTYFPISKEPKYVDIQDFNRYFARFRLPNGKEGWLSRDDVEYLDE